jgi:hypothetical protein
VFSVLLITNILNDLQQLTTTYNNLQQLTTTYNNLQQLTTTYNNLPQLTTTYPISQQLSKFTALKGRIKFRIFLEDFIVSGFGLTDCTLEKRLTLWPYRPDTDGRKDKHDSQDLPGAGRGAGGRAEGIGC